MNKLQKGDNVYCYFERCINDINMIMFNDFGIVLDIKTEIWIHPESKNRHEINTYIVKTLDNKEIVINGESNYKIVGLGNLYSNIEQRIENIK